MHMFLYVRYYKCCITNKQYKVGKKYEKYVKYKWLEREIELTAQLPTDQQSSRRAPCRTTSRTTRRISTGAHTTHTDIQSYILQHIIVI